MKQAFFDESSNNEVFLIAGWIADAPEWERFSNHWRAVLAEAPAIRDFKHHHAMSFEGDFTGWTEKARDAKVMALASVLSNYDVSGIAGGIKLSTFKAVFEKSIASKKELRNILKYTEPYEFCFHGIVATVLQQVAAKGPEVVEFIFDEQAGMGKNCIALYEEFRKNPDKFPFPPELRAIAGSITETTDVGMPPIQAADLLAGQMVANLKRGVMPEPLKMLSAARQIATFASFPPGFENMGDMIETLKLLLEAKAKLKEEKRRLVREGKWDPNQGWE